MKTKVTVWTSLNPLVADHDKGKPKCIFVGEISAAPRVGEYIVLREGFGAETVKSIIYNFVTDEIEISVFGIDRHGEYGSCLHGIRAVNTPN